jgi:hypothetical protein
MAYTVLLGNDARGSFLYLLREGDDLPGGESGIRWRLVAEVDDFFEAMAMLEMLHRRYSEPSFV